jgi:hypothetical protein
VKNDFFTLKKEEFGVKNNFFALRKEEFGA